MFYLYFSLNRKLRLISLPLVKVTDLTLLHWTVGQYRGQEGMSRNLIIVQFVHIRFDLSGSMLIKAFQKAANDKFLPGLSREKITRDFFLSNGEENEKFNMTARPPALSHCGERGLSCGKSINTKLGSPTPQAVITFKRLECLFKLDDLRRAMFINNARIYILYILQYILKRKIW